MKNFNGYIFDGIKVEELDDSLNVNEALKTIILESDRFQATKLFKK